MIKDAQNELIHSSHGTFINLRFNLVFNLKIVTSVDKYNSLIALINVNKPMYTRVCSNGDIFIKDTQKISNFVLSTRPLSCSTFQKY